MNLATLTGTRQWQTDRNQMIAEDENKLFSWNYYKYTFCDVYREC